MSRDKSDPDNPEWTPARFKRAKPASELPAEVLVAFPKTRGSQKAPKKIAVSLRLSPDVVEHFRRSGDGWQTRIDDALRDVVKKAG